MERAVFTAEPIVLKSTFYPAGGATWWSRFKPGKPKEKEEIL